MVEHSHLAWRLLVRRHLPPSRGPLLAYTPMFHSRLFADSPHYIAHNFPAASPPHRALDGSPALDRPLIAQFCSNHPADLLGAAKAIAPYVDAVDLNLGCPQGIARKGHYGAFLQDEWPLIASLISACADAPPADLPVPITAKIRIFNDPARTLEYAKTVLGAGATFLAVHGRTREQKGHNTGLADWSAIRRLRDSLPPGTVLFANGNVLWPGDAEQCLAATGADAVLSAEGCLYNPAGIFRDPETDPPSILFPRVDHIAREYLSIIREHVIPQHPRPPPPNPTSPPASPPQTYDPNLTNIKSHLFKLLHALLPVHTDIRAKLSRSKAVHPHNVQGIDPLRDFEEVVREVERVVGEAVKEAGDEEAGCVKKVVGGEGWVVPWWRCQPYVRVLPEEAVRRGAMAESVLGKKRKKGEGEDGEPEERSEGRKN
ncbi:dihydrouridine synthase-domain-containing protein [Kalaharituber pfeilii]|nr:dihydrouridine synthase-domain-containing protein [Kalaharituber pfeilii]